MERCKLGVGLRASIFRLEPYSSLHSRSLNVHKIYFCTPCCLKVCWKRMTSSREQSSFLSYPCRNFHPQKTRRYPVPVFFQRLLNSFLVVPIPNTMNHIPKTLRRKVWRLNAFAFAILKIFSWTASACRFIYVDAHFSSSSLFSRFSEESALKLLVQAVIKCSKASVLRESLHKSGSSDNLPPPIPISSRSASPDGKGEDRYARSMHPMSKSDSVAQHPQTDGGKIPSGLDINTAAVFLFEVLVKIAIQNRDRIHVIWTPLSEYIHELLNEASTCHIMLLQRVVVGLFRLMLRLMHNVRSWG